MNGGEGASNGKALVIGGSAMGGIVVAASSILWTNIQTVQKDAQIAIQVAAQHGEEMQLIRHDVRELRNTLAAVRAQMELGGRFTRADGDRMQAEHDRLVERIRLLEEHGREHR